MLQKPRSHLEIFNESVLVISGCGGRAGWVRGLAERALCPLKVIKDDLMARDCASGKMLEEVKEVKRRKTGIIIYQETAIAERRHFGLFFFFFKGYCV